MSPSGGNLLAECEYIIKPEGAKFDIDAPGRNLKGTTEVVQIDIKITPYVQEGKKGKPEVTSLFLEVKNLDGINVYTKQND